MLPARTVHGLRGALRPILSKRGGRRAISDWYFWFHHLWQYGWNITPIINLYNALIVTRFDRYPFLSQAKVDIHGLQRTCAHNNKTFSILSAGSLMISNLCSTNTMIHPKITILDKVLLSTANSPNLDIFDSTSLHTAPIDLCSLRINMCSATDCYIILA